MRLLAIQELPQSKRVKLVFDDDSVLKTQPYLIADFGLYSGMELTEEDYQALLAAAGKASAKARAVRIVAAAGVSEKELQKRLVRKGEEAADAQEAVGWLKELHLLDDRETARQLAASAAAKGYGKSRIKNILFEKGIPQDLWEEALAELPEMDDAIDRFLLRRWQGKDPDEKEVKRTVDALIRRGHSWKDIQSGLRRYRVGLEHDLTCLSMFYEILAETARALPTPDDGGGRSPKLRAVKAQIDRRFDDPELSVAALAAQTGWSEVYFRRAFRAAFGTSPLAYIRRVRLENAKALLRTGYYSVTETATRCGFDSVSYFSYTFRRETGVTPSAYRERFL